MSPYQVHRSLPHRAANLVDPTTRSPRDLRRRRRAANCPDQGLQSNAYRPITHYSCRRLKSCLADWSADRRPAPTDSDRFPPTQVGDQRNAQQVRILFASPFTNYAIRITRTSHPACASSTRYRDRTRAPASPASTGFDPALCRECAARARACRPRCWPGSAQSG